MVGYPRAAPGVEGNWPSGWESLTLNLDDVDLPSVQMKTVDFFNLPTNLPAVDLDDHSFNNLDHLNSRSLQIFNQSWVPNVSLKLKPWCVGPVDGVSIAK